jgi:hypothetical protein
MAQPASHLISVEAAATLDGLLRERVKRTPDLVACRDWNEAHKNWRWRKKASSPAIAWPSCCAIRRSG